MTLLPKLSGALVKDIRTGEGIAEWLLGASVAVLTAVGDLGVVKGATFLTILTGIKGIRRGLLKIVSLQHDYPASPIGDPLVPGVLLKAEPIAGKVGEAIASVDATQVTETKP